MLSISDSLITKPKSSKIFLIFTLTTDLSDFLNTQIFVVINLKEIQCQSAAVQEPSTCVKAYETLDSDELVIFSPASAQSITLINWIPGTHITRRPIPNQILTQKYCEGSVM